VKYRKAEFQNLVLQPHPGSATVETRVANELFQNDNTSALPKDVPLPTPINSKGRARARKGT